MVWGRRGFWAIAALSWLCLASAAWGASAQRTGIACAAEVPTIDWLRPGVTRCESRPSHEGAEPIAWTFHPEEPAPASDSESVVVAVHEQVCAGARNPIPYLDKPEVRYSRRAVVIRLWIHPPEGINTCPSNPIGRLEVGLPGRLGHRALFDGFSDPPRRVRPGEEPDRLPYE